MSRPVPYFRQNESIDELLGLSLDNTQIFLEDKAVNLPSALPARLHDVTGGNSAFLTLTSLVLRQTSDAVVLIEQLASVDNIERFLIHEVNDRLAANKQRVMEAVAALCGYPGTRGVVEAMLNQRDVRRSLGELCDQYLLTLRQDEGEVAYSQHQILQSFYYEQPNRATLHAHHQRAGLYYERERPDP